MSTLAAEFDAITQAEFDYYSRVVLRLYIRRIRPCVLRKALLDMLLRSVKISGQLA